LTRRGVACRLHSIALEGRWFAPGRLADVLEHEGFSADRLAARIAGLLWKEGGHRGRVATVGV
jgi:hypothetical protein